MLLNSKHFLVTLTLLVISTPLCAVTYAVGGCDPTAQNFTTIQTAVNSVPSGSTIEVCPGTYAEQVTITQSVLLQAIPFGNANRAIVTIPAGPHSPNVTTHLGSGQSLYAQILVQNAASPGPVTIVGITVDGAGGVDANGTALCTAGIFYAPGTSGTVDEVTVRNQEGSGCGYGIWAENTAGLTQTFTVLNSSVHDFDQVGIGVLSNQPVSTLNANVGGNMISVPATLASGDGIFAFGANAGIGSNLVTGGKITNTNPNASVAGIATFQVPAVGAPSAGTAIFTVVGNTVADFRTNAYLGGVAFLFEDNTQAQSNIVSNADVGFFTVTSSIAPTLTDNTTWDTALAVVSPCGTPAPNVSKNIFNDSSVAFDVLPGPTIQSNQLDNIDQIFNPCQ